MHVGRVLDRTPTYDRLLMLAVPFQWVNHPVGTTYPPGGGRPPPRRTDLTSIVHVGRPMGLRREVNSCIIKRWRCWSAHRVLGLAGQLFRGGGFG